MSVRSTATRWGAIGAAAVLVLSLSACGRGDDAVNSSEDLVVGISGVDPGLAFSVGDPGERAYAGFEVDLAAYVAAGLGWDADHVTFRPLDADQRGSALVAGDVDMVVSTYAITAERDRAVDFAGPYFLAGQDLLVAEGSPVTGPRGLDGLTVCGESGSADLALITSPGFSPGAQLDPRVDLGSCVEALLAGEVDAVTADDLVLAGWAAQHPADIKVVGSPFTTAYYGIGLPPGSPDVDAVDALLARAVDDGTWQADLERHLGRSGWTPPLPPRPGLDRP